VLSEHRFLVGIWNMVAEMALDAIYIYICSVYGECIEKRIK